MNFLERGHTFKQELECDGIDLLPSLDRRLSCVG